MDCGRISSSGLKDIWSTPILTGVRSALPAVTAERLLPDEVCIPTTFVRYEGVSSGNADIFLRHTNFVEPKLHQFLWRLVAIFGMDGPDMFVTGKG